MKTTKEIGAIGEEAAERFLKKRGWRILSRNFLVRGGEIDIIAFRFGVLAFFEVKSRTNEDFGTPASAVDFEKLRKIKTASRAFLTAYERGGRIPVFYPFGIEKKRTVRKRRIDVIEVYLSKDYKPLRINQIKDRENQL